MQIFLEYIISRLIREILYMMYYFYNVYYLSIQSATTSSSPSAAAGTGSSCATSLVRPVGKVRTAAAAAARLVSIAGGSCVFYHQQPGPSDLQHVLYSVSSKQL